MWTKPRALGEMDLPAPRPYISPPGHYARAPPRRQYALISHSAMYESETNSASLTHNKAEGAPIVTVKRWP